MNINKNLDKETIKQYLRNNFERIFDEYIEKEQTERNYFQRGKRVSNAECYGGYYSVCGTILDLDYSEQRLDPDIYRNVFEYDIRRKIYSYLKASNPMDIKENYNEEILMSADSSCRTEDYDYCNMSMLKDEVYFIQAKATVPIKIKLNLSQLDIDKLTVQYRYGDYTDNKKLSKDLEYYDYCLDEDIEFDKEEDECVKELLERKVTYETIDEQVVNWFLSRNYWSKTETDAGFYEIFGFEPDEEIEFDYEIKEEDDYLTLYINSKK